MLSLRAKIVLAIIGKKFNVNPYTCNDPVAKIKGLETPGKYKAPKGYVHSKEAINDGGYLEFVKPKNGNSKNLIYVLHGGAYVSGLIDIYRYTAVKYSKAGYGADVAFLDYHIAPTYKYPTALNDALDGWEKLLEKGYKPGNIMLVGDSAGGNLTLALMLKLRDMGYDMPRGAICMSPWADMTASGESYIKNFNRDVMFGGKQEVKAEMAEMFINSPIYAFCVDCDRTDPYLSPVFGEYHDFPPMMFAVGSDEVLLSDTLTIKEKLDKENIRADLLIGEHMFHVWPIFHQLFPEAKKAMNAICAFITEQYTQK